MSHRALVLMFLAAAGCGKVDKFVDSGGDDDSIDATTTDAPAMGTVNIVAVDRPIATAVAAPGVEVFVTGADGTAGARATTDTDGHATVAVTAGDSVTTVYPPNIYRNSFFTTFVNVAPGDTLTVGDEPDRDSTQVGLPMTLTWPAVAGTDYYFYYTPCGSNSVPATSPSVTIYRSAYCNPATFDVVVIARTPSGFVFTNSSHLSGATWTDGGTLTMPAFTPVATLAVGLAGLPANINYANLTAYSYFGGLSVGYLYTGGTPTSGSLSTSAVSAAGPNGMLTTYGLSRNGFGGQSGTEFAIISGNSHTITNPPLLKWLGEAIVNAATRQLTWIEDAAGADPADYLRLEISWNHTAPAFAFGGPPQDYFTWSFILPPNTPNRIVVPAFPDDLGERLLDSDVPYVSDGLLVERPDLNSWADVKALPEWQLQDPDSLADPTSLPGTIRTSQIYRAD